MYLSSEHSDAELLYIWTRSGEKEESMLSERLRRSISDLQQITTWMHTNSGFLQTWNGNWCYATRQSLMDCFVLTANRRSLIKIRKTTLPTSWHMHLLGRNGSLRTRRLRPTCTKRSITIEWVTLWYLTNEQNTNTKTTQLQFFRDILSV